MRKRYIMRDYHYIGVGVVILGLSGWFYYAHTAKVPPAPKDLTRVFPKQLLEKATPEQLTVLRGEANTAPITAAAGGGRAPAASVSATELSSITPAGLTVVLTTDTKGMLKGRAVNSTEAAIPYTFPAGTLFSNGTGDMVLLTNVSVTVPPKDSADLSLAVAQTSSANGVLTGEFAPHAGTVDGLQPLLPLLAPEKHVSRSAAQAAVLIADNDASLDVVASFPRNRPVALANIGTKPFAASPADLITALGLIREAGIDPAATAILGEPQLKVMTMLDPDSHPAAKQFFGISDDTEWAFWKHQLLQGDPALRHYALYGIARYYPDVALQMLPRWVRDPDLYRNYRLSAAWALALIDDARAQDELKDLQSEFQKDPGMRQAIDRALKRWENGSARPKTSNAG